jgi:hypothetical protein
MYSFPTRLSTEAGKRSSALASVAAERVLLPSFGSMLAGRRIATASRLHRGRSARAWVLISHRWPRSAKPAKRTSAAASVLAVTVAVAVASGTRRSAVSLT